MVFQTQCTDKGLNKIGWITLTSAEHLQRKQSFDDKFTLQEAFKRSINQALVHGINKGINVR